jgi:hypothetical protein
MPAPLEEKAMKSKQYQINALSHETVEDLNRHILSGKHSPAELAAWLENQGATIKPLILRLHISQVKNAAGLSAELHRRLLSGTDGQSTEVIYQELGDLGQVVGACKKRIRQLEQALVIRARDSYRPPVKPIPPYADPTAPKATE